MKEAQKNKSRKNKKKFCIKDFVFFVLDSFFITLSKCIDFMLSIPEKYVARLFNYGALLILVAFVSLIIYVLPSEEISFDAFKNSIELAMDSNDKNWIIKGSEANILSHTKEVQGSMTGLFSPEGLSFVCYPSRETAMLQVTDLNKWEQDDFKYNGKLIKWKTEHYNGDFINPSRLYPLIVSKLNPKKYDEIINAMLEDKTITFYNESNDYAVYNLKGFALKTKEIRDCERQLRNQEK